MKKIILVLFLSLACLFTFACSNDTPNVQDPDTSDTTVTSDNDTTASDDKRPMGGDDYCMVHISEYHSFPAFVTDWVINQGKDYRTWMDNALEQSADVDSDCAYSCANIYDFTEHFAIPKEIWIEPNKR